MSHSAPAARSASISVEPDGSRATLVLRRFLRHEPSTVWRAITDPQQVQQWNLSKVVVDGRPQGMVDLLYGDSWVHATGRILTWDPPRVYEHEWNVRPDESRFQTEERSVIRWELNPQEGGTLLTLTHRGLTRKTAEVFRHGLPGFLDRLEALVDGRPLPDWEKAVQESRRANSGNA
jgi:uncharacterized protein YndB with AHSA1/START domain